MTKKKDNTLKGTPPMVMFPARQYTYKVAKAEHKVTIPRKGNYHAIAPDIFTEEDGDFMVYDEENAVMYLPSLTKIMFATETYPDLKDNQLFAPIAMVFDKDTVDVIGQIVDMIPPK
jgi:hypothetical protein